jgi:DNA invertase Pin-like site-specific DNA recombinase
MEMKMEMKTKRVALYARVSTKGQTVENQLLDLRRYALSRGWEIAGEYKDEGISGTKDNRPALSELMNAARKRKVDAILVWKLDRFARSTRHLVNALDELRGLGVDFASYQENMDTTTAAGKLLFDIMAALAEFERSVIVERVHAGLRRARANGKRLGRPTLNLDGKKARQMKEAGLSVRRIAKELGASKSLVASLLSKNGCQNLAVASL